MLTDEDDYCYYSGSGSSFSSEAPPYPASPQLPPPQCELYSPSVLTRRTVRKGAAPQLVYVYETGRGRRKMALPKEQPMGNTPPFIPRSVPLSRNRYTSVSPLSYFRHQHLFRSRVENRQYVDRISLSPALEITGEVPAEKVCCRKIYRLEVLVSDG